MLLLSTGPLLVLWATDWHRQKSVPRAGWDTLTCDLSIHNLNCRTPSSFLQYTFWIIPVHSDFWALKSQSFLVVETGNFKQKQWFLSSFSYTKHLWCAPPPFPQGWNILQGGCCKNSWARQLSWSHNCPGQGPSLKEAPIRIKTSHNSHHNSPILDEHGNLRLGLEWGENEKTDK